MITRIYRNVNGMPMLACQYQEKLKNDDYRTLQGFLADKCGEVFGGSHVVFPSLKIYSTKYGKSTFRHAKGDNMSYELGHTSLLTGQTAKEDACEMSEVTYKKDGEEVTEKFGADFIVEGFVIASGRTEAVGIFGVEKPTYLKGITRTKIRKATLPGAKVFATTRAALTFIRNHEDTFRFLAGNYGWRPTLWFTSDEYHDFLTETMSEKKKDNMYAAISEANRILKACCDNPAEPKKEAYGETPFLEAIIRMRQLSLYGPVIRNFNVGRLMLSEFGGILYDLDEGAREAVEIVKKKGDLPYHVIKSENEYSVLYVSDERNAWDYERYDPATGHTMAFVKKGVIEETGTIGVCPCNGGLKRTF